MTCYFIALHACETLELNNIGIRKMKILMLVAHGSRNQAANDEVSRLAARVASLAQGDFDAVVPAFLELAEPDIHRHLLPW